jgi:hypothetical protein
VSRLADSHAEVQDLEFLQFSESRFADARGTRYRQRVEDGSAAAIRATALMGVFGIWYASDACARGPRCEGIEIGFHVKAPGAITVR